ncbi:claudin-16-like [Acipenser ruthenus]|uniref:claudin-16-like n=1 Tax=Acipenser ruthenus TaxID=7906 RepID=UPI00145ABA76|nr:claudin-16-like [Acipenser ruthenus]XP_058849432.1 claudin-16-like [Acipenser ruthenus]
MWDTLTEILGLVLGLSGIILLILANETDCWRQDAKDQFASVGLSFRCRGLWSECLFDNMANIWTCDIPPSYLGELPVDMVITRALILVMCVVCICAIPMLLCGMGCTRLVSDAGSQKARLTASAGTLFLFGGTSGAVGVLWYAVGTFIKYRREATYAIPGVTYELGYSYWFAVAGVVCVCAVGIMLLSVTCSTRKRMNKGKIHRATLLLTGHNNHMPTSPLPGHSKTYL